MRVSSKPASSPGPDAEHFTEAELSHRCAAMTRRAWSRNHFGQGFIGSIDALVGRPTWSSHPWSTEQTAAGWQVKRGARDNC